MRALYHLNLTSVLVVLFAGTFLLPGVVLAQSEQVDQATQPSEESAMVDSPLMRIGWPKISMPNIQWKSFLSGRESTAPAQSRENPISGALDRVSSASKQAADNVRGAWDSTLTRVSSFGASQEPRAPARTTPSFWSRMFGSGEPPREAETVQEFLAQERPGTARR